MPRHSNGMIKGAVNDMSMAEAGDNAKYLASALTIHEMGRQKKVDWTNYDEVYERVMAYFNLMIENDQKPTFTGLAMALGTNRQGLLDVRLDRPTARGRAEGYTHHQATPEVIELIRGCVDIMANLWEDYMQNGKINPASGIFIGKNFYGMRDQVDHVVATKENPVDNYDAEDIASRYISDESSSEKPPKKRK